MITLSDKILAWAQLAERKLRDGEFGEFDVRVLRQVVADDGSTTERTPMSGVVDRVPIIEQVYRDPAVAGALTSLLGPDFLRHPYTLSHVRSPGFPGQL